MRRRLVLMGWVAGLGFWPGQALPRIARCDWSSPIARWQLPHRYREVSGLALSDDGRVFLHNDEQGLLAAVNVESGKVVGNYLLGPGLPKDDFEGIAIAGPRLFLMSSGGRLYETRTPAATEAAGTLAYRVIDTGLGTKCEIEGLAYDPTARVLLIACKIPRDPALGGKVTIFRWSLEKGALAAPDRITVPVKDIAVKLKKREFRASGIERDPVSGNLILIASRERAIIEVTPTGTVVGSGELKHHDQAEGITFTARGDLVISDEGARGPGLIRVYGCR